MYAVKVTGSTVHSFGIRLIILHYDTLLIIFTLKARVQCSDVAHSGKQHIGVQKCSYQMIILFIITCNAVADT